MKRATLVLLLLSICGFSQSPAVKQNARQRTSPSSVTADERWMHAEIAFGGVRLKLGMRKEEVIATLAQVYGLRPQPNDSFWTIESKKVPPYEVYGTIGFDEGKLVYVSKRRFDAWNSDKAPAFVRNLEVVLAEFLATAGHDCTVIGSSFELPNVDGHRFIFQCGVRILSVDETHSDQQPEYDNVSIDEIIGTHKDLQPKK
jgi:hypothetical protein